MCLSRASRRGSCCCSRGESQTVERVLARSRGMRGGLRSPFALSVSHCSHPPELSSQIQYPITDKPVMEQRCRAISHVSKQSWHTGIYGLPHDYHSLQPNCGLLLQRIGLVLTILDYQIHEIIKTGKRPCRIGVNTSETAAHLPLLVRSVDYIYVCYYAMVPGLSSIVTSPKRKHAHERKIFLEIGKTFSILKYGYRPTSATPSSSRHANS